MDWESDIIWQFRNDLKLKQIVGERETPTGPSLYLARPIKITNEGCLTCHSSVDRAPATMIELYGTANGFGWELNEIVGSQIVSVPLSVPVAKANQAFVTFMASLVAIFAALFALINLMLRPDDSPAGECHGGDRRQGQQGQAGRPGVRNRR